jgi:hypothetical protein
MVDGLLGSRMKGRLYASPREVEWIKGWICWYALYGSGTFRWVWGLGFVDLSVACIFGRTSC